jgi:hypothetical protein
MGGNNTETGKNNNVRFAHASWAPSPADYSPPSVNFALYMLWWWLPPGRKL